MTGGPGQISVLHSKDQIYKASVGFVVRYRSNEIERHYFKPSMRTLDKNQPKIEGFKHGPVGGSVTFVLVKNLKLTSL